MSNRIKKQKVKIKNDQSSPLNDNGNKSFQQSDQDFKPMQASTIKQSEDGLLLSEEPGGIYFCHGDIVWAQTDPQFPYWPAYVFDPDLLPSDIQSSLSVPKFSASNSGSQPNSPEARARPKKVPVYFYGRNDYDLVLPTKMLDYVTHREQMRRQIMNSSLEATLKRGMKLADADLVKEPVARLSWLRLSNPQQQAVYNNINKLGSSSNDEAGRFSPVDLSKTYSGLATTAEPQLSPTWKGLLATTEAKPSPGSGSVSVGSVPLSGWVDVADEDVVTNDPSRTNTEVSGIKIGDTEKQKNETSVMPQQPNNTNLGPSLHGSIVSIANNAFTDSSVQRSVEIADASSLFGSKETATTAETLKTSFTSSSSETHMRSRSKTTAVKSDVAALFGGAPVVTMGEKRRDLFQEASRLQTIAAAAAASTAVPDSLFKNTPAANLFQAPPMPIPSAPIRAVSETAVPPAALNFGNSFPTSVPEACPLPFRGPASAHFSDARTPSYAPPPPSQTGPAFPQGTTQAPAAPQSMRPRVPGLISASEVMSRHQPPASISGIPTLAVPSPTSQVLSPPAAPGVKAPPVKAKASPKTNDNKRTNGVPAVKTVRPTIPSDPSMPPAPPGVKLPARAVRSKSDASVPPSSYSGAKIPNHPTPNSASAANVFGSSPPQVAAFGGVPRPGSVSAGSTPRDIPVAPTPETQPMMPNSIAYPSASLPFEEPRTSSGPPMPNGIKEPIAPKQKPAEKKAPKKAKAVSVKPGMIPTPHGFVPQSKEPTTTNNGYNGNTATESASTHYPPMTNNYFSTRAEDNSTSTGYTSYPNMSLPPTSAQPSNYTNIYSHSTQPQVLTTPTGGDALDFFAASPDTAMTSSAPEVYGSAPLPDTQTHSSYTDYAEVSVDATANTMSESSVPTSSTTPEDFSGPPPLPFGQPTGNKRSSRGERPPYVSATLPAYTSFPQMPPITPSVPMSQSQTQSQTSSVRQPRSDQVAPMKPAAAVMSFGFGGRFITSVPMNCTVGIPPFQLTADQLARPLRPGPLRVFKLHELISSFCSKRESDVQESTEQNPPEPVDQQTHIGVAQMEKDRDTSVDTGVERNATVSGELSASDVFSANPVSLETQLETQLETIELEDSAPKSKEETVPKINGLMMNQKVVSHRKGPKKETRQLLNLLNSFPGPLLQKQKKTNKSQTMISETNEQIKRFLGRTSEPGGTTDGNTAVRSSEDLLSSLLLVLLDTNGQVNSEVGTADPQSPESRIVQLLLELKPVTSVSNTLTTTQTFTKTVSTTLATTTTSMQPTGGAPVSFASTFDSVSVSTDRQVAQHQVHQQTVDKQTALDTQFRSVLRRNHEEFQRDSVSSRLRDDAVTKRNETDVGESEVDWLVSLEEMLLQGKREEALEAAMARGDWATAMLVGCVCPPKLYQEAMRRFADQKFPPQSPLHLLTLIYSNQALPALQASTESEQEHTEDQELVWRQKLSAIVSNKGSDWRQLIAQLGVRLLHKDVFAAHFAYVCGEFPPSAVISSTSSHSRLSDLAKSASGSGDKLPGLSVAPMNSSVDARNATAGKYTLLGCDLNAKPKYRLLCDYTSVAALRRTEVLEWLLQCAVDAEEAEFAGSAGGKSGSSMWGWNGSAGASGASGSKGPGGGTSANSRKSSEEVQKRRERLQRTKATLCPLKLRFAMVLADLGFTQAAAAYAREIKLIVKEFGAFDDADVNPSASSAGASNKTLAKNKNTSSKGAGPSAAAGSKVKPFSRHFVRALDEFIDRLGVTDIPTTASTANPSSLSSTGNTASSLWDLTSVISAISSSANLKQFVDGPSSGSQTQSHNSSHPSGLPSPRAGHRRQGSNQDPRKSQERMNGGVASEGMMDVDLGGNSYGGAKYESPPMSYSGSGSINQSNWFLASTSPGSISPVVSQSTLNNGAPDSTGANTQSSGAGIRPGSNSTSRLDDMGTTREPGVPVDKPSPKAQPEKLKTSTSSSSLGTTGEGEGSGGPGIVKNIRKGLLNWFYPDAHDASENIGKSLEAYFDKQTGKWVFPGEENTTGEPDPAALPPPTMGMGMGGPSSMSAFGQPSGPPAVPPASGEASTGAEAPYDPLAALMAPPSYRMPTSQSMASMPPSAPAGASDDPLASLMAPPSSRYSTSYSSSSLSATSATSNKPPPMPNVNIWKPPPTS